MGDCTMTISRRAALKTAVLAAGSTLAAPTIMRHAALGADPIKVAGIHDASGGLDIYGKPMVACLDMAVAEANAAGGPVGAPAQVIKYDPQTNTPPPSELPHPAPAPDKPPGSGTATTPPPPQP